MPYYIKKDCSNNVSSLTGINAQLSISHKRWINTTLVWRDYGKNEPSKLILETSKCYFSGAVLNSEDTQNPGVHSFIKQIYCM